MQRMIPGSTAAKAGENEHSSSATVAFTNAPSGASWRDRTRSMGGLLGSIFLLGLAAHMLFFAHSRAFYAPDSSAYVARASNLVAGHGFTTPSGEAETLLTPGYPLLIAPFLWAGLDLQYLVLLQHLMQVLLTVATAAFAFRFTGGRRQALITGILLSVDLPMLEAANTILTETLFTVTLAAGLWLLWTGSRQPEQPWTGRLFLSGLLTGASVLIRPVNMFFFFPAAVYLLLVLKRFRLRAVLGFATAFACFPLMWAARNYHETGYFTVSSISGWELLRCRAAGIMALNDPGDFNSNLAKRMAELQNKACDDLKALYGRNCSELSFPQKSAYYMRLGRKIVVQHPIGYLKLALRGAAVMWLDGGPSSLEEMTGINPHVGIRLLLIYTVPAFCFALVGLLRLWNTNRQLFHLIFLTIAYFVALSSGGESYSRYRVPVVPLYAILIAAGIDAIVKHFRGKVRV